MSKKKRKEIGWIEIFYGDFWAKRKKLIIAGFFIPLFFSFFLYVEFSFLLSWIRGIPFNLETLFHETMAKIGYDKFLILFLILLGFSIFYFLYTASIFRFIESLLRKTWREIFQEKKKDPRLVLVKNILISSLVLSRRLFRWLILTMFFVIAFVLGILLSYLFYVYLDLFSIPSIIHFVSFLPFVGDTLTKIATYMVETLGTHAIEAFRNIPPVFAFLLFAILIFLMFPTFDLVETRLLRKRRGNIGQILKNGFRLTTLNLNLLNKLGDFFHRTFLCLFTDQATISIDIPIVNDRNLDIAMHTILSTNQRCYVVRLPAFSSKLVSEFEKLPKLWQEEVKKIFETELEKSAFLRILAKTTEEKRQKVGEGVRRGLGECVPQWMTFAIGENGCIAYAMISVPPPTYMTRMITLLWCNDPGIKERIVDEIEKLE